ncbi:hypothetical protein ACGFNY_13070 [Streptomyces chartreusis]|uniref:hypothetical protein n=1 Tax=Streptomyces chartreusis TaxID=1969 RepID=UPI00371B196C
MDSNDLQRLAADLDKYGLQVTVDDSVMRLNATNPLNSRLTEEILTKGDQYVTGFDYAIGEHGHEQACAERIARMLAVGTPATAAPTEPANRLPAEAHR